jgi:hypothetical protein
LISGANDELVGIDFEFLWIGNVLRKDKVSIDLVIKDNEGTSLKEG